jgi:hypothetical protein
VSHAAKAAPVAAPAAAPKNAAVTSPAEAVELAAEELARRAVDGEWLPARAAVAHRFDQTRIHRQAVDAPAPAGAPGGGLLVEDDQAPSAGQMRKSAFLDELYATLCRTVERGFEGTPYEGRGCPFLEQSIDAYRHRPAADGEAMLRRWAGEAAGVTTAAGYVPVIERRVRRSVEVFVATGDITGVPDELRSAVSGGGLLAGFMSGGLSGGIASALGMGLSRLFFKERPGATPPAADPATVRARLGSGHGLDSGAQARMESAFGWSFSHVRIHDDEASGRVAEGLAARAFTVGTDIAFAPGEYRPGSLAGEALIAHELAHVVQQGPGTGGAPVAALEADADEAAATALLETETQRPPRVRAQRLAGLQLLRCSGTKQAATPEAPVPKITDETWADVLRAADKQAEPTKTQWKLALVEHALRPLGLKVQLAKEAPPPKEKPSVAKGVKAPDPRPRVSVASYAPVPVVNFDPELNKKWTQEPKVWTKEAVKKDRRLSDNAGYAFLGLDGKKYVVLGPKAFGDVPKEKPPATGRDAGLDALPDEVRMVAEHELFHADRHLDKGGDESDAANEFEAYTNDFINYFHKLGSKHPGETGRYWGNEWLQFLVRYEEAPAEAQKATFDQVVAYYESLSEGVEGPKTVFDKWVRARSKDTNRDREKVRRTGNKDGAYLDSPANWLLIRQLADKLKIPLPKRKP